ncbi:MAG: HlyD family efflux transporter periplasmic adaptor subunit [Pirellulaceae bacterium]
MSSAQPLHRTIRRVTRQMRLDAAHQAAAEHVDADEAVDDLASEDERTAQALEHAEEEVAAAASRPLLVVQEDEQAATEMDAREANEAPSATRVSSRTRPQGAVSNQPASPALVAETRRQVDELAIEISQLAKSDCGYEQFCRGFLDRVCGALATHGGGVWEIGESQPRLLYAINLAHPTEVAEDGESPGRAEHDDVSSGVGHRALVAASAAAGQSLAMPPRSRLSAGDAINDSEHLLLLAPVAVAGNVQLVIEVLQRPGRGPVTERGYLRFLERMCQFAAEYLRGRRLREYGERDALWEQVEGYLGELHQGLNLRRTLYTIANEGRRLIGCDRVSVALCRGRRCNVEVVSGLESFDKRAQEVKRLGRLARAVVVTGEPLWFDGSHGDLPPQIEVVLHDYIDRSHARKLIVLPLNRPLGDASDDSRQGRECVGALIVEQLAGGEDPPQLKHKARLVARHAAPALANAVDHDGLFLLPLWKAIGRMRWVVEARNLPKVATAIGVLAALVLSLLIVPYRFDVAADGKLQPQVRREVFASIEGTVVEVPVEHLQQVAEGDIVARLRNTELEQEIETLLGQRTSTRERLLSIQRALLDTRLNPQEQNRLNGELATLQETADSIERMMALVREKEKRLDVRSPTTGQVSTWQVRDILLRRLVQGGQSLMTVIDPTSAWELELRLPERRLRHLIEAAESGGDAPLEVTFVLATHPDTRLSGRVVHIDRTADVRDANGNTVLVRVAIDKDTLPDLRDGAKVTARVHCGERPLGYVLFHDLIETVQAKVLFWF